MKANSSVESSVASNPSTPKLTPAERRKIARAAKKIANTYKNMWAEDMDLSPIKGVEFPVIGVGGDKTVVDLMNGTVLKVQRKEVAGNFVGDQVKEEIKTWKRSPASKRKLLAPVLANCRNGNWLVMPKAEQVGNISDFELNILRDNLLSAGISTGDAYENNVGMLEGQWVLIDYGYL